ncbi:complement C3-H1-like precursor [Silurus asotus]|uniref:Complement C3-H1-like n=1 Tax=Silurus asotus TaxID=30991 RepID=A0AAD5AXR2_SILAS|nr:complement C3-H1-like precursor [Silurus asotus]
MSTSQILKVGTEQKVFVEVQDYEGNDELKIDINVMNIPSKQLNLASKTVTLNQDNKYQANVDIKTDKTLYTPDTDGLPSFDVSLITDKSFFYADDESFSVKIKAKYLFGENVEGSAFVVFGVFQGNEKTSIQSSLDRVNIKKGEGTATLTRQQIIQTFPDILKLVGETLYISVSVLTSTGSEMVEAERRGIHIVTSPYTIQFTKTPRYFKPGMPFTLKV